MKHKQGIARAAGSLAAVTAALLCTGGWSIAGQSDRSASPPATNPDTFHRSVHRGPDLGPTPNVEGGVTANVSYNKLSDIVILETITDIGGGQWLYEYEIIDNVEPDGIWFLFLYTSFANTNATPFNKIDWGAADATHLDFVFPCYDARNIEPGVTHMTQTWGPPPFGNSPNPIVMGELVDGFSFVANVYDPDPKLYGYEVNGNYCGGGGGTGPITAIGYTVSSGVTDPMLWGHEGFVTHPGQGAGGWDVSMAHPGGAAGSNVRHSPPDPHFRVADYFVVGGGTWDISEIVTYAYETNAATPTWTGFNANVWDGPPDDPNSVIIDSFSSATVENVQVYRVFNGMGNLGNTDRPIHAIRWDTTGLSLDCGEYWFDWQVEGGASGWANYTTLPDPQGGAATTVVLGKALQLTTTGWEDLGNGYDSPLEVFGIAHCPADFTCSGMIGGGALGQLLANWGPCASCAVGHCPWDLNGDCVVDGADLGQLLSMWGPCPAQTGCDCPQGGLDENEPCGSDTNGGCNSTPPVFTFAAHGDVWCGNVWADGDVRDTDWYRVTVGSTGTVSGTVTSIAPQVVFIVDANWGNCTGIQVVGNIGHSENCVSGTADASGLTPGADVVVFTATGLPSGQGIFNGYPCGGHQGGEWEYVLEISAP